jgi:membrane protein implicated in regulation of membrane protease activity
VLVPGLVSLVLGAGALTSFWAFWSMPASLIWWSMPAAVPLLLGLVLRPSLRAQERELDRVQRTERTLADLNWSARRPTGHDR